jgi:hypothetical protein
VRDGGRLTLYLDGYGLASREGLKLSSPALDRLTFFGTDGAVAEWAWYPRALPVSRVRAHAAAGCDCQPRDLRS